MTGARGTGLPARVWVAPSTTFDVVVMPPPIDPRAPATIEYAERRIALHPCEPVVGLHVGLIHELIHVVERKAIGAGLMRRRWSDALVDHVAVNVLAMLVLSGLYRTRGAFTVADAREYFAATSSPRCRVCRRKKPAARMARMLCAACEELAALTLDSGS